MEGARAAGGRDRGRVEGRALRLVLGFAVVAVAAAIAADQLFVHPIVGLADNGDFFKVMQPAGLAYATDDPGQRYWSWALVKFRVGRLGRLPGEYKTSETPLVIAAVLASRLVRPGEDFDVRILGLLHLALFVVALVLIAFATRGLPFAAQLVVLLVAAFFFTDVGYVALFNSLYSQTASWLFLLLTLGIAAVAVARGRLEGPWLWAYFVAAAGFVGSKPQEWVQGPALAVLGLVLARVGRPWWKRAAVWLALALAAFAVVCDAAISRREIREVGLYHSVFMELLPLSNDPRRDLRALGLDPELARYSGVTAYQAEAPLALPDFRAAFFEQFGYADLMRFYLRRPDRLFARVARAGRRAFTLRTILGNFDIRAGLPPAARSERFAEWSRLRERLGGRLGILWIALFLAGNLVAALALGSTEEGRLVGWTLGVVVVMAVTEFIVCAFADYLGDVSRHLYVFQGLFDLLLVFDAGALVAAVAFRLRPRPVASGSEGA